MTRTDWEVEIIYDPTGESMIVYFGDETAEGEEPLHIRDVIGEVIDKISIVPRKVS